MITNLFRISPGEALYGVGEIIYTHDGKDTSSSAYEIEEKAIIKLKIPRSLGAKEIKINFFDEYFSTHLMSFNAVWSDFISKYDIYIVSVPLEKLKSGLYFYNIEIDSAVGKVYGYNKCDALCFSASASTQAFQFSVSDFKYNAPEKYYGGIIYHIFVDRFYRGKNTCVKKSGYLVKDWGSPIPEYPEYPGAPIKNNYFYGGNIWGIIDKLDYIKSLGVTIIYLSPIFEASSNHKYDTADYMRVDKEFGGDEALGRLITNANKKGISVILDGVFNHTGSDSIYFNKYGNQQSLGAYQSQDSEYYTWYDFKSYPEDYTSWWGIDILPRINPDNPKCKNYFVGSGGVIEKYAKMGVSGFRLDVVDELSDAFTESIKKVLNHYVETPLLYGEVWEDASNKVAYGKRKRYYLGSELDGVMNYPLRRGIISFLRNSKTEELYYALTEVTNNAPKRIRDLQMNIIGTHDTERIITVLGGESSEEKSNSYLATCRMNDSEYKIGKRRLMLAYTMLSTLPGLPCIFYGDEAGLEGYSDPFNRRTFPWGNEDSELLIHYRKLGEIRHNNSVYKTGDFKLLYLDSEVLIFSRNDSYNSYITIINNRKTQLNITFSNSSLSLFTMKKSKLFSIQSECSLIVKAKRNSCFEF